MKLVVFGLSVSSSWGNGHATLWRGLIRALAGLGHHVVFFERDVPYYAAHRDLAELPGGRLVLYPDWAEILPTARAELASADAAVVTSYCPDGVAASDLVVETAGPLKVYYDLDTPVTLDRVRAGEAVSYLPHGGLREFDLVLSFGGGRALDLLRRQLGARRVAPLYGSADPTVHRPVEPVAGYAADLSYLGTYAQDRQQALEALFLGPARRLPGRKFLIGGSLYPPGFPWARNVYFVHHVAPTRHPAFFASSRLTLNLTRAPMASLGFCPPGRLFEAAACGAAIVTDRWDGLEQFFTPGREVIAADTTEDVVAALDLGDAERARLARAARARTLREHTAEHRAAELVELLQTTAGVGA